MNSARENSVCCGSGASSRRSSRAAATANGIGLDDRGLGSVPVLVDEQRLGRSRDLPGLLEDRLD
ncbi:MAG: hypothetical protein F4081_02375 [Dehalococcoidia bacterium]|nr:hypothetical protein [Dehalococcoidia bacterium]